MRQTNNPTPLITIDFVVCHRSQAQHTAGGSWAVAQQVEQADPRALD